VNFAGATLQDTVRYDIHKIFDELFLLQENRDGMILEGIQSEDLCKIRTLAERLFGHQYAVEMLLSFGQRSAAWVKRLPDVVAALNNEVTHLSGKKLAMAIKAKVVSSKPPTPYSRPVGAKEKKFLPT